MDGQIDKKKNDLLLLTILHANHKTSNIRQADVLLIVMVVVFSVTKYCMVYPMYSKTDFICILESLSDKFVRYIYLHFLPNKPNSSVRLLISLAKSSFSHR